jgi:cell division protein FtsI (penicillin-binding protein 3)
VKRTRQERFRLGVLFVLVCTFFIVAAARLGHLQVLLHPQCSRIVQQQSTSTVSIPAERGLIYDRNGTIVANNVTVSSLYAYPVGNDQLRNVCNYLERLFNLRRGSARKKFGLASQKFRWIKRTLNDELARAIEANAPRGLYLRKETQRVYPFDLVGKQVLGFTDIDHRGLAGVELSYDSMLAGREGLADIRRDGLRNTFRVKEAALVKPEPGRSLVLTIDWQLQEIVQQELRQGVEDYQAKSGMAVFLDCNNGDVLAAAHFDPEEKNIDKPVKLRVVTDQFEPGSVFKAFTVAELLESGLVDLDDSIYCEEGKWKVGRRFLHDDKKHGWLTFGQVIELSSNIGVAKCAIDLGGDELYQAARRFGMGQKLDIGLPGEIRGSLVRPKRWSDYTVAALAMGHSVAVTPLQMAAGFAAIANGGKLLHPRLILGWVDENKFVPNRNSGDVIRQVMNESSAATLRTVLQGVVERGTAEAVYSPVITIAGKTGTAEIPDLENHRYFKNKFVASFAGFFPCDRPLIAGIVVLHQPGPIHYGGWTAGPIFRKIAERYLVLRPDLFQVDTKLLVEHSQTAANAVEVPDLIGRDLTLAATIAHERGLKLRAGAQEGHIIWQFPAADRLVFVDDEILAAAEQTDKSDLRMIDLKGLSTRQAAAFLQFAGITCRIMGNGRVAKQSIRPGEKIAEKMICQLECRPP